MTIKAVELSKEDWQEIYYAVLDKANGIRMGKYGERNEDGVDDDAWVCQLLYIAEAIGPDGKDAGTRGGATGVEEVTYG